MMFKALSVWGSNADAIFWHVRSVVLKGEGSVRPLFGPKI